MALIDKLKAIADAIRSKTGKTDVMTLDEMPSEIASISGGGGGGEYTWTFPEYSFVNIGDNAFKGSDILLYGYSYSPLTIPKFVRSIGETAFQIPSGYTSSSVIYVKFEHTEDDSIALNKNPFTIKVGSKQTVYIHVLTNNSSICEQLFVEEREDGERGTVLAASKTMAVSSGVTFELHTLDDDKYNWIIGGANFTLVEKGE